MIKRGILDDLLSNSLSCFKTLPDNRRPSNATKYSIESAFMGALSVFINQDASFLSHQARLRQGNGIDNFSTIFGIAEIPSANQIRNILDNSCPSSLLPLYENSLATLKSEGGLSEFEFLNGHLIAFDGTDYHSSKSIHCDCCNTKVSNDKTTYSHSMLACAIVSPEIKEAIALPPEFIIPNC